MPESGPACLVCLVGRAKSDQVVPRRPNLLTHFPDFSGSRPDPPGHDLARHFGSHFGSPPDPIDVHHLGTSKPPTAFPLVGGPSSVSTQSAPEGIRTPNLLIRSQMLYPLSYGRPSRSRATREQTTGAPAPGEIALHALARCPTDGTPRHPRCKGHHDDDRHFRASCKFFHAAATLVRSLITRKRFRGGYPSVVGPTVDTRLPRAGAEPPSRADSRGTRDGWPTS
jgi:hypothetical protein